MNRRKFARLAAISGASVAAATRFGEALVLDPADEITAATIEQAENIAGLQFTAAQRDSILSSIQEQLEAIVSGRGEELGNHVIPSMLFEPLLFDQAQDLGENSSVWSKPTPRRPASNENIAFLSIGEQGALLRAGKLTSVELTALSLQRLNKYDPVLECVITLTESMAMGQARRADEELASGFDRGPLHGIPYGLKDLVAVEGYRTTWGATPYKDQIISETAEVAKRLEDAGAVLVAKLSLGALAWGDIWFGGRTNNPWNLDRGSSGSSAGPGAAVSAGLVSFAIGSETLGSIVSPATRTGVTGLRPTFGSVSRHGAMTLSWSMDKLGPMCRSAECCAMVFDAIHGADSKDPTSRNQNFSFDADAELSNIRIGYIESAFANSDSEYGNAKADRETLRVLRSLGADLQPISLPEDVPIDAMLLTLNAEAASAFDDLIRTGAADTMVRQDLWPQTLRAARFIPAVDYIQANRHRTLLMQKMSEIMKDIDVFVSPSFRGSTLRITNLTGHPCVCVPNAFHVIEDNAASPRRNPGSISFVGGLFKDDHVLTVAHAYQKATDYHTRKPPIR